MTGYLLGDINPSGAALDKTINTFIPLYEHYYEERIPEIYTEKKFHKEDGTVVTRKFDLVRQKFVD